MKSEQPLPPHALHKLQSLSSPDFHREAMDLVTRFRESLKKVGNRSDMRQLDSVTRSELDRIVNGVAWENDQERQHDLWRVSELLVELGLERMEEVQQN